MNFNLLGIFILCHVYLSMLCMLSTESYIFFAVAGSYKVICPGALTG